MLDVAKEALEYVVGLRPARLTTLKDGSEVFDKKVERAPHPLALPLASTLELSTLHSLVQFATANVDGVDLAKWTLHVEGPQKVALLSPVTGSHRQRENLASAVFTPGCAVYIDRWLKLEDAIIGLLAEFDPSGDRDLVIGGLKAVKTENAEVREDSGISQQVTARAGTALVQTAVVPNPVSLAPFRTFPEIAQPLSLFALRLRDEGKGPEVLLKQADGGRWRVEAAASIGAFLVNALKSSGTEGALPSVIY